MCCRRGCVMRSITVGYIWKALNGILSLGHVQDRDAGYFPNPLLKFLVIGGNDKAWMLGDSFQDAVVCIRALVHARKAFHARILRYA